MPRSAAPVLALLVALSTFASAQLAPGDVGVTWLSSSSFTVFHANGSSNVVNVGSFLGTGTTATIALSPTQPNTYLIAGAGFLGAAQMTGPATASWSLITTGISLAAQLSFDGVRLIVMDFGTDQIVAVDLGTGNVTPLTSGPQPWGTDLNAGTVDPRTGRLFAGGNNGIWVLAPGSSTPQPYASGWVPTGASSYVSGIVMDDATGLPVASLLGANRIVRIDAGGVLTDLVPPGSIPGPNAIEPEDSGNFIVGASFGQIYRVPRAGGTATLLGTATGVIGAATGVAPLRSLFRAFLTPAGGGAATLAITGIPVGTVEGWTIPTLDVTAPLGQGPILGITPDALSILFVTSFPTAVPGFYPHWSLATPTLAFPTTPETFPAGFFPSGLTLDLLALAISPAGSVTASPPRRITMP